jgi:hypothetical protein
MDTGTIGNSEMSEGLECDKLKRKQPQSTVILYKGYKHAKHSISLMLRFYEQFQT